LYRCGFTEPYNDVNAELWYQSHGNNFGAWPRKWLCLCNPSAQVARIAAQMRTGRAPTAAPSPMAAVPRVEPQRRTASGAARNGLAPPQTGPRLVPRKRCPRRLVPERCPRLALGCWTQTDPMLALYWPQSGRGPRQTQSTDWPLDWPQTGPRLAPDWTLVPDWPDRQTDRQTAPRWPHPKLAPDQTGPRHRGRCPDWP
jgi:hypothetical protein